MRLRPWFPLAAPRLGARRRFSPCRLTIVVPDAGKAALNWFLWINNAYSAVTAAPLVHLYTSALSLGPGTTLSALQAVEATATGYLPQALTGGTDGGIQPGDLDQVVFNPVTFTVTVTGGSNIVYGYWIDALNAGAARQVLGAEAFPVPMPFSVAGQLVQFTPQWSMGQL